MKDHENAVQLNGVCKERFGVLKNVSFCVPKGTIAALIGANGAGKTTILRVLTGIAAWNEGEISLFGDKCSGEDAEAKARMGVMLDDIPYGDVFTAGEIGEIFRGIFPNWSDEKYADCLADFDIAKCKKIKEMSKGAKQKLQLACAMSHEAELLVLDEPTANLDPAARERVMRRLMEYMQDGERSILLTTNSPSEIAQYIDHVTLLREGSILFSAEKNSVLDAYGILMCGTDETDKIDAADYVGRRLSRFGAEMLVTDRALAQKRYPGMQIEPATLDDIMIFYTDYAKKGERENYV